MYLQTNIQSSPSLADIWWWFIFVTILHWLPLPAAIEVPKTDIDTRGRNKWGYCLVKYF